MFGCLVILLVCNSSEARSPIPLPIDPQTSELQLHLERARTALKANSADTAVKEYLAVLDLDPKNVEAQANLGVILFFEGDCKKASGYFSAALTIQPSLAKAQALLGICEKRLGDTSARALLEKSFSELTDAKLRVQVGMELAGLYYSRGDLHRAASLIQALLDLDPDNLDALYSAQLIYSELADDALAKLAVLAPGSARMQQVIGERLINAGDLAGAIEHYRKALALDPRLPGIRYELSQAILQSAPSEAKAQTEAQALLEAAVKIEGDNAKIECEMGAIAVSQQDLDGAYAHYDRALALNPREAEAQMGKGRLLMEKRQPEEAIKFLLMAIESDPLNGEAHYRLALAYRDLHRQDETEKELRLFQNIKKTKEQVKELYKQMNKQPGTQDDNMDAIPKHN
ncbi:MAG TPA: tetratricopeptide repeat protein [Blastocatellia bacterium]|nr:tetratricopeptide repeat protein [Blastocatellia bacterium]